MTVSDKEPVSPSEALPLPKLDCYFETARSKYWVRIGDEYIPLGREDVAMHLAGFGYNRSRGRRDLLSEAESEMRRFQTSSAVDYVGEIAGYRVGVMEFDGRRFLIPRAPKRIAPVKGEFPTIEKIYKHMTGDAQLHYMLGWHQVALRSVYTDQKKPGQLLVLAGPPGCGKSLWQNRVVTPVLGGRVARPLQFMRSSTSFNEDLIRAEHLMLEDEMSSTDIKARREFGANIKALTVSPTQRVHGKGKTAFYVPAVQRLTLSVNDEAENLAILPPLDESLIDKMSMLRCQPGFPFDMSTPGARQELEDKIAKELPAFIHYLLEEYRIPEEIKDDRFGVKAYHHEHLIQEIHGLAPETGLLDMIEKVFFTGEHAKNHVEISAGDLQITLIEHPDTQYQARKILTFPTACGVYLSRLNHRMPERVQRIDSGRKRLWKLHKH